MLEELLFNQYAGQCKPRYWKLKYCVSKTQGLFLSLQNCQNGLKVYIYYIIRCEQAGRLGGGIFSGDGWGHLCACQRSEHNKHISVMGWSILSGKNAKCSES
eukprot:sb/3478330/